MTRGLNRNFNRTLKGIFKGAATTVIAHQTDNPFRTAYDRLCDQGRKPNLAKVTVARKLAATALAMWKKQEAYDPKRWRQRSPGVRLVASSISALGGPASFAATGSRVSIRL